MPLANLATFGIVQASLALLSLIAKFSLNELAVQACDVGDGFALGADGLAGTGVGAVAEAQFVHLGHHVLGTTGSFYATLGKQGELADLRADEQHGRTVLTCSYAGTATDAAGAVHCLVGILLGNKDGVGILSLSGADGGVAACLDNLVEGTAVNHAVLDNGEASRTPGLYGDGFAVLEATHVELAGGGATLGLTMGRTVDVQRAHAADTLAAVVVEHEGLLTRTNEPISP